MLQWMPISRRTSRGQNISYDGAAIDMVDLLAAAFNFSYTCVEPADKEWGSRQHNSTWTGIIGMSQRQGADLCPVPYSMTPERASVLEFSVHVLSTYNMAVYMVPSSPHPTAAQWLVLLPSRDWQVYLGLTAAFCWVSLLLTLARTKLVRGVLSTGSHSGALTARVSLRQDLPCGASLCYRSPQAAGVV
ncbi:glutamate receptor ionotropic, delta-1-like isoform X2 [Haliotis rufescens]|uniref:glutamate receptor ionotropic, delta-1-like isoform X2 n=1 Tax=Haliotis rufescens TaxID=6454 RepID=UPI00201F6D02|nr:glutamate receptor ionotropic, delta-1-like isoform X2 [Haliotis rufescens]